MRVYSADGLILRTYRYGEADRIVVFLTDDRGKKRGVAKNATKSRRRFGAALEPLTRGRVAYVEREHRDLVRLDRIEPTGMLLGRDAAQAADGASVLGHAAYFAELLDEWSPDGMANERLFRLGAAVGAALGQVSAVESLARYFEYWLLRLEGVYPAIDVCPRCERRVLAGGAVLALAERAYVCGECAHGGPKLSADAMRFLHAAATRTPAEVGSVVLAAGPRRELAHVHDRLIATHLEKELRSTRIVKELGPDS